MLTVLPQNRLEQDVAFQLGGALRTWHQYADDATDAKARGYRVSHEWPWGVGTTNSAKLTLSWNGTEFEVVLVKPEKLPRDDANNLARWVQSNWPQPDMSVVGALRTIEFTLPAGVRVEDFFAHA